MEKDSLKRNRDILKFLVLCVVILAGWQFGKLLAIDREAIQALIKDVTPVASGVIFVLLYVALTSFFWLAKDILRVAAVFVFGIYGSTFWIWAAEAVNAVVLFHVSRQLGREFVEEKLLKRSVSWINRVEGFTFGNLLNLRAVILVPFRFLDLGFGLTKISFVKYLGAVLVGSPVRIFFQQFFVGVLGASLWKDFDFGVQYMSQHPGIASCVVGYFVWTVGTVFYLRKKMFQRA